MKNKDRVNGDDLQWEMIIEKGKIIEMKNKDRVNGDDLQQEMIIEKENIIEMKVLISEGGKRMSKCGRNVAEIVHFF